MNTPAPAVIHVTIDQVALNTMVEAVYAQGVDYGSDGSPEPGDPYPAGYRTIADLVVSQVLAKVTADTDRWDTLRRRVTQIRDEEIRAAVLPLIAAAITTPFERTNAFGEPNGTNTTLRELILKQARAQMQERTGTGHGRSGPTVMETIVAEAVTKELAAFIAGEVKVLKDALSKSLASQGAAAIEQVVKNALAGR